MQTLQPFRRTRNLVDICQPQRRLDDDFQPDLLLAFHRGTRLRDQHVNGVNIAGGADLRDHDGVQPFPALLHQRDHITVAPVRLQTVDSHGDDLPLPVHLVQRRHDVVARLVLVGRRDRVFKVQAQHVGRASRRFREQFGARSRHEQLRAVKPRRRPPIVLREAHVRISCVEIRPSRANCPTATLAA